MIIDKKGKFFGKISIIDIVIILVVVLCIAGAYLRFSGALGSYSSYTPAKVKYTYQIREIRQPSVDAISKQGDVFLNNTSEFQHIGTITDVKVEPSMAYMQVVSGDYVQAEVLDRYNVTITIECDGFKDGNGIYSSSKTPLQIGSEDLIATKWVAMQGTLTDIIEVE